MGQTKGWCPEVHMGGRKPQSDYSKGIGSYFRRDGRLVGWLPKFCPLTGVVVTRVATLQQFGKLYIFLCVASYIYVLFYNKRSETKPKIPLTVVC